MPAFLGLFLVIFRIQNPRQISHGPFEIQEKMDGSENIEEPSISVRARSYLIALGIRTAIILNVVDITCSSITESIQRLPHSKAVKVHH